jgi:hypothetical protein
MFNKNWMNRKVVVKTNLNSMPMQLRIGMIAIIVTDTTCDITKIKKKKYIYQTE